MKKKVIKMKLHKALQPSFIKRMYYMRFIGKFTKAEKEKNGENFLYNVYRQYHLIYKSNLQMNIIYLKGYVAIKRMKRFFQN